MQQPSDVHTSLIILFPPRWVRRTYGLLAVFLGLTIIVASYFGLWFFGNVLIPSSAWYTWVPGIFLIIYAVVLTLLSCRLYAHSRTKLLLSPEGIQLDSYWETVTATWEQVEQIATVPIGGVASEAVLLRSPARMAYRWHRFPYLRGQFIHAIPLSGFGRTYGNDPLAQALGQFAPSLQRKL